MKLLIVEDEDALATGLTFNFEQEGYEVVRAGDGTAALEAFDAQSPFDCVILDLMLPGTSGYDVCRQLRERDRDLPILVLSARTLSQDKAQAFDCGTDQYVTKPFDLVELLSRVRNLIERRQRQPGASEGSESGAVSTTRRIGDVLVDFDRYEVHVNGTPHSLTTLEMKLLRYFLDHEGRVLPRMQILEDVWGDSNVSLRTIDNFVLRLRKLVDTDPEKESHILSVRGTGYRFQSQPSSASADSEDG